MDYCARESTLNPVDEVKDITIKMNVQEAYSILSEMNEKLKDLAQLVNGKPHEEKVQNNAGCLLEESRMVVGMAYLNLQIIDDIRKSIF